MGLAIVAIGGGTSEVKVICQCCSAFQIIEEGEIFLRWWFGDLNYFIHFVIQQFYLNLLLKNGENMHLTKRHW